MFVGAGPGAPDLITLRGMRCIQQAEVVLYDALIAPEMLELIPASAERMVVGKRCGKHSATQDEINVLLVAKAQQYQRVVRLKGGDPTVFGRLDEEIRALESASIPYAIVPGVTATLAASASLKLPLTVRDVSRSVTFLTASITTHQGQSAMAQFGTYPTDGTLAFYMGRQHCQTIAVRLIAQGWSADTPMILVHNISWANEQHLSFTLGDITHTEIPPCMTDAPVLVLVGNALRGRLSA
jgi:uroporphyrin-III C-methyltransferase